MNSPGRTQKCPGHCRKQDGGPLGNQKTEPLCNLEILLLGKYSKEIKPEPEGDTWTPKSTALLVTMAKYNGYMDARKEEWMDQWVGGWSDGSMKCGTHTHTHTHACARARTCTY